MAGFADSPTITRGAVTLRPMVASDAANMWADLHDDEATRLTGTHGTFTREQIDAWCASRTEQDDRLDFAVTDTATGEWLGEAVVSDWDPDNRSCSFRIALSAHARDRGVGTLATQMVVDHVFDEIDDPVPVHRLSLEVFEFNDRAMTVYERIGFQREGVLRDALQWDGAFYDAVVMSIVRSDRP